MARRTKRDRLVASLDAAVTLIGVVRDELAEESRPELEPEPPPHEVDPRQPHRFVAAEVFNRGCSICGLASDDPIHQAAPVTTPPRPPRPPRPPTGRALEVSVRIDGSEVESVDNVQCELADLGVFSWQQRWPGFDASRITVAIINGFEGVGLRQPKIEIQVDGKTALHEPNCYMPPRQPLWERYYVGPDAARIRRWEHYREPAPVPAWLRLLCQKGAQSLAKSSAYIGPYLCAHAAAGASLRDFAAVGGEGVGPYSNEWPRQCREGLAWKSDEWRAWANRARLARIDRETLDPITLRVPYWPGRNPVNEAEGWRDITVIPANAASWAPALFNPTNPTGFAPPDISHLWRMISAASCVAFDDPAAQWYLTLVWADVASWLDGDFAEHNLLQPIAQLMKGASDVGNSNGGRQLAHAIGCYLAAEPWLTPDKLVRPYTGGPWAGALEELVTHYAIDANGITHAAPATAWPAGGGEQAEIAAGGLTDPICRVFEQDMLAARARDLGVTAVYDLWCAFAKSQGGTNIQEFVEARVSAQSWTAVKTTGGFGAQYPEIRMDFSGYPGGNIKGLVASAATASPNENPLDRVPWDLVAEVL